MKIFFWPFKCKVSFLRGNLQPVLLLWIFLFGLSLCDACAFCPPCLLLLLWGTSKPKKCLFWKKICNRLSRFFTFQSQQGKKSLQIWHWMENTCFCNIPPSTPKRTFSNTYHFPHLKKTGRTQHIRHIPFHKRRSTNEIPLWDAWKEEEDTKE